MDRAHDTSETATLNSRKADDAEAYDYYQAACRRHVGNGMYKDATGLILPLLLDDAAMDKSPATMHLPTRLWPPLMTMRTTSKVQMVVHF